MKKQTASKTRMSRRTFARAAALAAAAAAVKPSTLLAQEKAGEEKTAPTQAHPEPLSPASQADVDARYANIIRQYGSRLSDEEKGDIRRMLTEGEKGVEALRAYQLENGDEPATVLHIVPNGVNR